MSDEFVSFESTVGNSSVPYPWVVGAKRTYLLPEDIWLENQSLNPKLCPYENYYKIDDKKMKSISKTNKIKGLRVIQDRILK